MHARIRFFAFETDGKRNLCGPLEWEWIPGEKINISSRGRPVKWISNSLYMPTVTLHEYGLSLYIYIYTNNSHTHTLYMYICINQFSVFCGWSAGLKGCIIYGTSRQRTDKTRRGGCKIRQKRSCNYKRANSLF